MGRAGWEEGTEALLLPEPRPAPRAQPEPPTAAGG